MKHSALFRQRFGLPAILTLLALPGVSQADTVNWATTTAGSFNLNTASGWNATPLWDNTTIAQIQKDFTAATFPLDGSKTLQKLTYDDTGTPNSGDVAMTLSVGTPTGTTLTFAGAAPTVTTGPNLTIAPAVNLSAGGLNKAGAGILTLNGTTTYTVNSTNLNKVTAGTLAFGSASGVQYNWSDKASGGGTVQFNAAPTTTVIPAAVSVAAGVINQNTATAFTTAGDFAKNGTDGVLSLPNNGASLTVNGNVTVAAASATSGKVAGLIFGFIPTVTGSYAIGAGAALTFVPNAGAGTETAPVNYTIPNAISISGPGNGGGSSRGVLAVNANVQANFSSTITLNGQTRIGKFSNWGYMVFNGKITGTAGGSAEDLVFWAGGGGAGNLQRFVLNNSANDYDGTTTVTTDFGANGLLQMGANDVLPETTTVILDNNWNNGATRGPSKTGAATVGTAPFLELQGYTQTIVGLQSSTAGAERKVVWGGLSAPTSGTELGGTLNLSGTSTSINVGVLTGSALLIKNVTVNQTGTGSTASIGAGATLELIGSTVGGTTLQTKGVTGTGTLILSGGSGTSTLQVGSSPASPWVSSATPFKLFGASANNLIDTAGNNAAVDATMANFDATAAGFTKSGTGTLALTGPNTYTGDTTITNGILNAGVAQVGSTSGPLGASGNIVFSGGALQFSAASASWDPSARIATTASALKLDVNGQAITFGTGLTSSQSGGLTLSDTAGGGSLTISAANAYTGNTTISAGTLALGASGTLAANSSVNIAAGATFDVTAKTTSSGTYTWGASAGLTATGGSSVATAAQMTADSTGTVDVSGRPLTLAFTPTSTSGDSTHPALNISAGTLNLNSSTTFTLTNNGAALDAGDYTLISGNVTGTPTSGSVSVGGNGLFGSSVATLTTASGSLVLHVSSAVPTTTTITLNSPWTSTSTYGDALSFHVVVTGASPTGTITVKDGGAGGTEIGSGALIDGAVDITLTPLNILAQGTHANIVAVYPSDPSNAASTSAALDSQTVSQKTITLTGATAQNKVVNGSTAAVITGGSLVGLVGSDSVTAATGTFPQSTAGTSLAVTVLLSGPAAGNYTLTDPGLTATIFAYPTWATAASGLWGTAGNWVSDLIANGSGITADFSQVNLTADTIVSLNAPRTVGSLVFGDTDPSSAYGWTLDNNSTPANILTLAGGTPTVTVALGGTSTATISAVVAGTTLVKAGAGPLILSGANTYSGITTINAGTLTAGSPTAFGPAASASLLFGPGTSTGKVQLNGNDVTVIGLNSDPTPGTPVVENGSGTAGTSVLTVNNASANTFAGVIQNGSTRLLGLTKSGVGKLTLFGANSYTGATTVRVGTLLVNSPGSLAAGSAVTVAAGGTLGGDGTIHGSVTAGGSLMPGTAASTIGTLTLGSSLTLNGNTSVFDLPASGTTCDLLAVTGNLVLNGANYITLNAPNGAVPEGTYTLMTYAAQTGSGTLTFPNGLLTLGNATLAVNSTSVTLTVGPGSFNMNLDTWSGSISAVWDGGINNWERNGTALQPFTAGDAVTFNDSGSAASTITSGGTVLPAYVFFNNNVNAYTVSANMGSGSIVKNGSGQATLTGTVAGAAMVNGGILAFTNPSMGLTSATVASGASLQLNQTNSTTTAVPPLTLNGNGSAYTLDIPNGNTKTYNFAGIALNGDVYFHIYGLINKFNFNNSIVHSGVNSLTFKTDGGNTSNQPHTITLSAASNYTGNTTLNAISQQGILKLGIANALPATTALTLAGGGNANTSASLDLAGFNQTLAGLSAATSTGGTKVINSVNGTPAVLTVNNTTDTTYAGTIGSATANTSNIHLTKGEAYKLTLTGANRYTGTTTISGGILNAGVAQVGSTSGPLGASGNIIFGGGTLQFSLASAAWDPSARIAAGTSASAVSIDPNGQALTFATGLTSSQSGGLTLTDSTGTGSLTLSATNAYTGNTTINSGTLVLGASGALPSGSSVSIAEGATFDVSAIGTYTWGSAAGLTATGSTLPAILKGGTTVDVSGRPITLTFTPTSTSGDSTHPALNLSAGTLALDSSTTFTLNNNGAALGAGDYTLISGVVTGTPTTSTVLVGGSGGLAAGNAATLVTTSGQLVLHVFTVEITTTTLTRTAGTSPSTYGDSLTFHAVVSPDPGAGSTIIFQANGVTFGSAITTTDGADGVADLTLSELPASGGSPWTVTAVFAGNLSFAASSGTLSGDQQVDPYALTLTGATALDKIFDGTTAATITGGTLSATVNSDEIGTSATFATSTVGIGKAVTVTLTGAAAPNYSLTLDSPSSLTASIFAYPTWATAVDGLWGVGGNWVSGTIADGSGVLADFSQVNLTADTIVSLNAPRTVGSLVFGDTDTSSAFGWTVDNNSTPENILTLAGGTPTVTVNALGGTSAATISAVVAGTTLAKAGAGTLTLSGANTYTGTTSVSAGTLQNGSATTFTNRGALSMSSSGTFDLGGHNAAFTSVSASAITNKITNSGAEDATLTITQTPATISALITDGSTHKTAIIIKENGNSPTNLFKLDSPNTFSGGILVAGTSVTQSRLRATGTTWTSVGTITDGVVSSFTSGPFGTGTVTIGLVATDRAGLMFDAFTGTPTVYNDFIFNTPLGPDNSNGNPGIRADASMNFAGTLTSGSSDVIFNGNSAPIASGKITGSLGLTVSSNFLTLSNINGNNDYPGTTTIGSTRTLNLGAANQIPNGTGKGNVANAGTFNLNGFNETINGLGGAGVVDSVSGTPTLELGDGNATGDFTGAIKNTGGTLSLVKIGSGTQTLSGANSFTGGLYIKQGTVNGSGNDQVFGTGTITLGDALVPDVAVTLGTGRSITNPIDVINNGSGTTTISYNPGVIASGPIFNGLITLNKDLTIFKGGTTGIMRVWGGITGTGNLLLTNSGTTSTFDLATGSINNAGTLTLSGTSTGDTTISAVIGTNVTGVIQNSATSKMILSGVNTYTGDTTVNAGTLVVTGSSIKDTNKLVINGGKVDVPVSTTEVVGVLVLGGVTQYPGTYGSTASTATYKDDAYFSGSGMVEVTAGYYENWADSYPLLIDKLPGANPDGDGLTNFLEYAFGTDPTAANSGFISYDGTTVTAGLPTTNIFGTSGAPDFRAVFGRRLDADAAGLTYTVQFSTSLGEWIESDFIGETVLDDNGTIEMVSIPYPFFIPTSNGMEKPTFFRVGVNGSAAPDTEPQP